MNGLAQSIFKFLPAEWILNTFLQPSSWIYSKLIVIFKKETGNHAVILEA